MTIQQTIQDGIKTSLKSKDTVRLSVLRGLSAAFTNELVAVGRKPQEALDDEGALKVISRAAKQRKDSIEQFEKGGRQDLADNEKAELKIIEEFLPQMMGEDEIRAYVLAKKDEMGIDSADGFGQIMGAVMNGLKGRADGTVVKKIIEECLEA